MPHRPDNLEQDAHWRTAGERIQNLLDASASGGAVAHERAEQLVREVADLYGAGLERMMGMALKGQPELADAFAADDLIASLLLVHGLHPHDVERRVEDALDSVRPYLGSHGGDVHLLEVEGETVRLQFAGSCKSCPSSSVTLELAVEDAVRAAAPEISSIEVVAAEEEAKPAMIPADSLLSRVRAQPQGHGWHPVPDVADLAPGEVGGFAVAGSTVLACRLGDQLFAYRDRCGACGESLAGAALHRRLGSAANDAVLRCPRCHAHFDVVHAGACVDGNGSAGTHLEPVPLLERDGVLSIAVAEVVAS
ncbi:NifU family protein [Mycolicibacterium stellerae]|uniref:NifU family protein n=1 Tax=Mycolicibacterium stellerae TaxID=2358193 RepID=UPI000F0BB801|nr:NifU family protein [Mycolicibacterium stellerae]